MSKGKKKKKKKKGHIWQLISSKEPKVVVTYQNKTTERKFETGILTRSHATT